MALGVAAMLLAAPAPAQLALPVPGGNPQRIDFADDPVLAFAAPGSDGDFRARIAAAVLAWPGSGEAEAGQAAAAAARAQARSALLPVLTASLSGSRSFDRGFAGNAAIVEGLIPRGRTDAQFGVDQLLFDFGASSGRIAGASARLRAARAEAQRSASDTALAAAAAWYQVLAGQTLVELADALVARHRAILADTAARVHAGLGAGGDVARAEAGLADAMGEAARTARRLAAARARYRELFGSAAPAHPPRPALAPSRAGDADTAQAMSHNSPEVQTALALAEAARAEARATRAEALPRLTAGVSATRFAVFEAAHNHDVRGQFSLSQRLSTGGAEAARTDEAAARARAAGFASDRVIAGAERDAETALADVRILDTAVETLATAYRANRRNRDTMAEQFRLSRGSLIDLIRTEQDYVAAARALIEGSIERDLAHLTLLARTGELLDHFGIVLPARP
ncbi:MAG: hypothetical protein RL490_2362 [Pseudomonadota bacterium]